MHEQAEYAPGCETHSEMRLACLHLPGCLPCACVYPVAELLASRSLSVEFIDCFEDSDALGRFGGEATPYWCLLKDDEVVDSLYPADDEEELYDFVVGIDPGLSRESFDAALSEGKRKADFIEACQAELAMRSPETDAVELMGAARLKIAKPCLSVADGADIRSCVERSAAKLQSKLQERIALPGGDTPARRELIEHLPALIDELSLEIADILQEKAKAEPRGEAWS